MIDKSSRESFMAMSYREDRTRAWAMGFYPALRRWKKKKSTSQGNDENPLVGGKNHKRKTNE